MGGSEGPGGDIRSLGDLRQAREGINREKLHTRQETTEVTSLEHTLKDYKQEKILQAKILSGEIQTTADGGISFSSDTELVNAKARNVQAISGGIAAAISLAWITYFGTDMPAELYAVVPVFLQVGAQALATAFNTKKGK